MRAKRVVYTVVTSGYEALQEQSAAPCDGVDFLCFTDSDDVDSNTWQIRRVPLALPCDTPRSSRRMKILAHEYVADYDESLYIDNTVRLKVPAATMFDALLPPDSPMAVVRHSFRGTLTEEFAAVIDEGLDASWVCEEQRRHYACVDPAALDQPTLWGGLLLRRHNVREVAAAMRIWWENVLRYSRRDQLSLPVALRSASVVPAVHDLDINSSDYHDWPTWPPGTSRAGRPGPSGGTGATDTRAGGEGGEIGA